MGARPQHGPTYRRMCGLLRGWRRDAGLTQRSLALRLRRPHSFVWKTEAGERRMDPVEFVAWCRACGVPPAEAIERLEHGDDSAGDAQTKARRLAHRGPTKSSG